MTNFGLYTYTNASNAESGAELTEADKGDWYVVETEGIYMVINIMKPVTRILFWIREMQPPQKALLLAKHGTM